MVHGDQMVVNSSSWCLMKGHVQWELTNGKLDSSIIIHSSSMGCDSVKVKIASHAAQTFGEKVQLPMNGSRFISVVHQRFNRIGYEWWGEVGCHPRHHDAAKGYYQRCQLHVRDQPAWARKMIEPLAIMFNPLNASSLLYSTHHNVNISQKKSINKYLATI